MSFEERFDDESKKFRKNKSQIINKRNQKINLIKEVKEMIADLMKNEIEQIKRILLRVIEILKADLKENIENSSKLIRTLNRIKSRFQIIEKQNANQSIKTKSNKNRKRKEKSDEKNDYSEFDSDEKEKKNDVEN